MKRIRAGCYQEVLANGDVAMIEKKGQEWNASIDGKHIGVFLSKRNAMESVVDGSHVVPVVVPVPVVPVVLAKPPAGIWKNLDKEIVAKIKKAIKSYQSGLEQEQSRQWIWAKSYLRGIHTASKNTPDLKEHIRNILGIRLKPAAKQVATKAVEQKVRRKI